MSDEPIETTVVLLRICLEGRAALPDMPRGARGVEAATSPLSAVRFLLSKAPFPPHTR